MFESYRDLIGSQTSSAQEEFFSGLLTDDPVQSFRQVTKELSKLWHFGRYSLYIYTECLHRCMGLPIKADTMFLREADSPRAGLAIATGHEELAKGSLNTEQWSLLEKEAASLMAGIQQKYPTLGMDHWFMESCLCAYKGYFRRTKGRYLPYYLDRMRAEIDSMVHEDITSGVDWNVLYDFRREHIIHEYLGELATPERTQVTRSLEHVLQNTGEMIGLEPIYARGVLR